MEEINSLCGAHNYPYELRVAATLILATSCDPGDIVHLYRKGELPTAKGDALKRRSLAYDAMPGLLAEIALILCDRKGLNGCDQQPVGDGEIEGHEEHLSPGGSIVGDPPPLPEVLEQEEQPPSPRASFSDAMSEDSEPDAVSVQPGDETDADDVVDGGDSGPHLQTVPQDLWAATHWPKELQDSLGRAVNKINACEPSAPTAGGTQPTAVAGQSTVAANPGPIFSKQLRTNLQRNSKA